MYMPPGTKAKFYASIDRVSILYSYKPPRCVMLVSAVDGRGATEEERWPTFTPPFATAILPNSIPSGFHLSSVSQLHLQPQNLTNLKQDVHMYPIPNARIHIPHRITMDPIREPIIAISKNLPIRQPLPVRADVEAVDVRRRRGVVFTREGVHACVRHVDVLPVWAELDAVGRDEVVCHGLDYAGGGFEAVDLWPDAGFGAEVSGHLISFPHSQPILNGPMEGWEYLLPIPIPRVRKPQIPRPRMLHDIIQTTEIPAQEIIQQHPRLPRRGVHARQL